MGSTTQQYSLDTWVSSSKPSANFEASAWLQVQSGARLAFVYFTPPFLLGASVLSAKLTLTSRALAGSGSRSLTVRRTKDRPMFSRMTWANAPAGISGPSEPKTVTKTGALGAATEWVFDVTSHMQAVSDGSEWAGWRVESDSSEAVVLYGMQSGSEHRPRLEVVWSDAPDAPSQLSPAGGRVVKTAKPWLRWDYTDVAGDTDMAGLQVQINSVEAGHSTSTGWSAPLWDSGQQAESKPELNLATSTYAGIPSGGSHWWSVRVKDGADLWSKWSDPAEVRYVAPASLALVSPAPGGTVGSPSNLDDVTPVVSWSLTGATQEAYRVRVWLNAAPKRPLWDSGRRTSTDTSVTVKAGVLRWDDRLYRVRVDVWDNLDRTSVPGFTAAYTVSTIAFLNWSQTLAGTDTLSARAMDPYPFVELEWTRSPAPDGWTITRGGEVIADLDYADAVQADGTNRWVDRYAPPRTELRYTVRPRVNGKTAWGNPTAVVVSEPVGIWLVNDTDEVCLIGVDEGSWSMGETTELHEPISGDRVVQVRSGMRGYEGSVSGLLAGDVLGLEGVTADEWRDALLRIKRDGGANLIASTLSIPVYTADVVAAPTPAVVEQYDASLAFWQRGRFDWDEL